jgi:hypothetical protein
MGYIDIHQGRLGDINETFSSVGDTLSGTDPSTGLPIYLELIGGVLGALLLARVVGGAKKNYRRSRRKSAQTKARRAALKAQLAAL